MDFNIRKPAHIIALLLLIVTVSLFIVYPVLSYFGPPVATQLEQLESFPESFQIILEIILLVFQLALVIGLLIFVPLVWYRLVNGLTLREMFARLKLRREKIDMAVLWGIITAFSALILTVAIGILLIYLGFDLTDSSNIPELEQVFSLPSLLFIIVFQPVGEEIFFRGFLLEKIDSLVGTKTAIIGTALLFGIAHLSAGNVYPAFTISIVGVLLAYLVVKTKNLYAVITAHISFNLISFGIYLFEISI